MYQFRPVSDRVEKYHQAIRNRSIFIETERALIVTEAYKKYKHYPPILRRPLMTKAICEQMSLHVDDQELFVGQVGRGGFDSATGVAASCITPDIDACAWIYKAIDNGNFKDDGTGKMWFEGENFEHIFTTQEEIDTMLTFREFWQEYMFGCDYNAWQPDGYQKFVDAEISELRKGNPFVSRASGHLTPGHQNIIKRGYKAIHDQAQAFLDEHYGDIMGEDINKYMFYQSVVIVTEAAMTLIKRYAAAVREKMEQTTDEARKAELAMMADGLENISENPARTFWEALQAVVLYLALLRLDNNYPGMSLGRCDQYSWPLLEKELEAGTMTLDKAQEYVDMFVLKTSNLFVARHPGLAKTVGAGNTFQHITLGGVDPKTGEDASNPVTYMFLETMCRLHLHDPLTSLRVHKNTPPELWECAITVTERIGGLPLFQNDEVIIPGFMKRLGFTLEDARDYSLIGCQEQVGSGNDYPEGTSTNCSGSIVYAAAFATALNNGVNPLNGKATDIETGYLYDMNSIEEVHTAMERMMRYALHFITSMDNYAQWVGRWACYHAMLSISMDDCMEKGMDAHQGGCRYNSYGGTAVGMSTIADSLAAIKYMCFDKKICTTKEFYDALMANWVGYEELQQRVLSEVPHYGNDDPYVDVEMKWVMDTYVKICDEISSLRSNHYKPGAYSAAAHIGHGALSWATPDGRSARQPLADAASPGQGRDASGPIAIVNSASNYDQGCFQNGMCLNIKFHPTALQGDGHEKLAQLTQTYFENGGAEIQYNVVSNETLRAAQANPEEYRDLIVRIAGYSAYFVEMPKALQDDLISRNEQML